MYVYCQQRTKSETVPIHDIKVGRGNGSTTPLILISVLGGREWSPPRPCSFIPRKEPLYPLNRRLGRPQSGSGWFWKRENFIPLSELTSWTD